MTAASERRLLSASSLDDDDRFGEEWRRLAGVRSLLAIPVDPPRRERGGLVVVFFAEQRTFTDDDLELGRRLAGAARAGLERSELYEGERTARALSQQLARMGSLLATELEPAAILEEVADQAPSLLGADACAIQLVEGDELVVSAVGGATAPPVAGSRSPSTARPAGDVVQTRSPVVYADAEGDERLVADDPILAAGHAAYLGVPLVGLEQGLQGVLAVYSQRPRVWREEEVEALAALAGNASAVLSNAELYQRVALERERSYAILSNIADGIVAVDREGKVVLWNESAEAITGVPGAAALGRTPVEVLQRELASGDEGTAGERLLSIQRGGDEVWLSLTEAVMHDPVGSVSGPHLRLPRRLLGADRRGDEVDLRLDRLAPAARAADVDLRLRRDAPQARRPVRRGGAADVPRVHRLRGAAADVDRRHAAQRRAARGRRHAGRARADGPPRRRLRCGLERPGRRGRQRTPLRARAARRAARRLGRPREARPDPQEPARQRGQVLAGRRNGHGRGASPGGPRRGQGRRRGRRHSRGRARAHLLEVPPRGQHGGYGGAGLGLFIARGLVLAMGGRIWVDSAEGGGSSFAFELPLAEATEQGEGGV